MAAGLLREAHLRRVALAEKGLSAVAIAQKEGVSHAAIKDWARRHRIELEARWDNSDAAIGARLGAMLGGASAAEVLQGVYRDKREIAKWCARHGISAADRPFLGLDEPQKIDVVTLVVKADYPLAEAIALVKRPKVRVPLMVPRSSLRRAAWPRRI